MSTSRLPVLAAGLLAACVARADGGRIPLYTATTIASPGSYVVTRDISSSGVVLTINANDVTVDLDGHTLTRTTSGPVINIAASQQKLIVRNGTLTGSLPNPAIGQVANFTVSVSLIFEDIVFRAANFGVFLTCPLGGAVEIRHCQLSGSSNAATAIEVAGGSTAATRITGVVADNVVDGSFDTGMRIDAASDFLVRGNVVRSTSTSAGEGILLGNFAVGCRVEANNVKSAASDGIVASGPYNDVVGNTVFNAGDTGIFVGSGCRVRQNTVVACTGDGILTGGDYVSIEENVSEYNGGCGISLVGGSTGVVYRTNTVRANTGGGICDAGSGNTNAGGNF